MAGRAGRRGIDTIGHVIHCNNLFKLDTNSYKNILLGGAKLLNSKFKISFNLILKIIYSNNWHDNFTVEDFKKFIGQSMIKESLDKEQLYYTNKEIEINSEIDSLQENLNKLSTPLDIFSEYKKLKKQTNLRNNQKKKNIRLIADIENNYDIVKEYPLYEKYNLLLEEQNKNRGYKNNAVNYIENNIQNVLNILIDNQFITSNFKILERGIISSQIQEVHSLVIGELYEEFQGFKDFSCEDLIYIFSCFTNINVDDNNKIYKCSNFKLIEITSYIQNLFDKYEQIQNNYYIPNDTESIFHLELIDILPEWIKATQEKECLFILEKIKSEKNIFLGDFIKAILKINTIAAELDKICEILNNLELKQKLSNIGNLTLKFIATNQSLYI